MGEKCVGFMGVNLVVLTKVFPEQTCIVWANPNLQWAVLRKMESGCVIFQVCFQNDLW